jgi:hypothetical protein
VNSLNLCIIAPLHHRWHLQPLVSASGRGSPASTTWLHCLSPSAFIAADRTVTAAASLPLHQSSAKHDLIRPDLFCPSLTSTYHLVFPVAAIPRCFLLSPPPHLVPFAPIAAERTHFADISIPWFDCPRIMIQSPKLIISPPSLQT